MSLETRGGQPSEYEERRRTGEYKGTEYVIQDLDQILISQINVGDRVLISTSSGNRYMLRQSHSRSGALTIYSERDGFSHGYKIQWEAANEPLATTGRPMNLKLEGQASNWLTTDVCAIELRKGFDELVQNDPSAGNGFESISKMLKDHVDGRHSDR